MPNVAREPRKKVSLNLPPGVDRMLQELIKLTGLNKSEVVQNAIRVEHFLAEEIRSGRKIYSLDENGENPKQLVLGIDLLEPVR